MSPRILIVRLGALGDLVHALPVAAAIRERWPDAIIDWVVDGRHAPFLEFVPVLDERVTFDSRRARGTTGWVAVRSALRGRQYDVALDIQGLIKSALVARLSGARRVIGFAGSYLRERPARAFYNEAIVPSGAVHVIEKNLALLTALGMEVTEPAFPIDVPPPSDVVAPVVAGGEFALVNPGGGWPNKRWPPDRLGRIARHLADRHGLRVVVLWGPGEEGLARQVADAAAGRAEISPPTTLADLLALLDGASLLVSGDSGPLHLAAALATPVVGIFGPTSPQRNGPWSRDDVSVSRSDRCGCSHLRQCRQAAWCLDDVAVDEVAAAVDRRVGS